MLISRDYQLGLLYLVHALSHADGVIDEREQEALNAIRDHEGICDEIYNEVVSKLETLPINETRQLGLTHLQRCSDDQKKRVLSLLYHLSEADGLVHVNEIKLVLSTLKLAGVQFRDVVDTAQYTRSIFIK